MDKTKTITIRAIDVNLWTQARILAVSQNKTVSQIVNEALSQYINEVEK
jgi:predicted DNA-binding protein